MEKQSYLNAWREYKERVINSLYQGLEKENYSFNRVKEYKELFYIKADKPLPIILVADNLNEMINMFQSLTELQMKQLSHLKNQMYYEYQNGRSITKKLCQKVLNKIDVSKKITDQFYLDVNNYFDHNIGSKLTINDLLLKEINTQDNSPQEAVKRIREVFNENCTLSLWQQLWINNKNVIEESEQLDQDSFDAQKFLFDHIIEFIRTELKNIQPSNLNEYYPFFDNMEYRLKWTFFKMINDKDKILSETAEKELNTIYENSFNNMIFTFFSDDIALSLKCPEYIKLNENGEYHAVDGPAIAWNKNRFYYINGREIPSWIFEKGFTKKQFITEENSELMAAMYEILKGKGEQHVLDFLGAEIVDEKTIVHKNGESETMVLYKTKETFPEEENLNGNRDCPLAWLKMTCPSTGTNYLIPTDSSFTDAVNCAKYHRPERIPEDIRYSWDSRN